MGSLPWEVMNMGTNTKYKFSNLAKDLSMKNKELIALLAKVGIEGKQHFSAIEPEEYNLVMSYLTASKQIQNLDAYMSGEATIHAVKPVEEVKAPQESAKDEKAPAPKAEEAKPAPKSEGKSEEAKADAPKPEEKKVEEKKNQSKQVGNRAQSNRMDRFQNRPDFTAPKKEEKREDRRATQKNQAQKPLDLSKTEVNVTTLETTSSSIGAKGGTTRVIDTRSASSSVDLSKYDEKLEAMVPEKDTGADKQKIKKNPSSASQGGKSAQNAGRDSRGGKDSRLGRDSRDNRDSRTGNYSGRTNVKNKGKHDRGPMEKPKPVQLSVQIPDEITVGELAQMLKVTASEVVKRLFLLGMMATVNQTLDYDTAALVAEEIGAKVSKMVTVTIEEKLFDAHEDSEDQLIHRAPVVCVMGHVDHGKTSILEAIRHTSVTRGEAGGITQHIGAYRVSVNGQEITFLDTPGHEAFTAMRARGAMATDIAILVVAADDGIMPQTVEAINHAKAAGLDIIVAINKMDKPTAQPDVIKQQLTQYDLVPEEWGGDVICVPVSALTHKGIDDLLENVLLVAEMKDLKANPNRRAKGIVIEAKLDKGRGPVATVLVQNGTLHAGDVVIAGTAVGRVRAMINDRAKNVKTALPSEPVEIIGLSEVPSSGDEFQAVEDERMARELAEQRKAKMKEPGFNAAGKVSLDDLFAQMGDGSKELNVVVKADVVGSMEAVKQALLKIEVEGVKVKIIHAAVGGITESDVMLAAASEAIIIGFNVRPDKNAIDGADRDGVDIRTYRIIYECIEEITAAMKGMLAPTYREQVIGHVEIRQTIRVPGVGTIAGSYVLDGKITRKSKVRVLREGTILAEDEVSSLKRFKDDAKEVATGYECGVGLRDFNDMKIGDIFEVFEMVEVERK